MQKNKKLLHKKENINVFNLNSIKKDFNLIYFFM